MLDLDFPDGSGSCCEASLRKISDDLLIRSLDPGLDLGDPASSRLIGRWRRGIPILGVSDESRFFPTALADANVTIGNRC